MRRRKKPIPDKPPPPDFPLPDKPLPKRPPRPWSGIMSKEEAACWEQIMFKVAQGTPPRAACSAAGFLEPWMWHRRTRSPLFHEMMRAADQGIEFHLNRIQQSSDWRSSAWVLERTRPEEFASDSSIRQCILGWAQDTGMDVADLNDLVRMLKVCHDLDIDLGALVDDAIAKKNAEDLDITSG